MGCVLSLVHTTSVKPYQHATHSACWCTTPGPPRHKVRLVLMLTVEAPLTLWPMSYTTPSGAIDLDMLCSLLNTETPYQSAEHLYGDAADGGQADFLVDFCLQPRINPKARQQNSLNNFKEDGGRYQPSVWYTVPCSSLVIQVRPVQACLKTHQGLETGSCSACRVCCQAIRRLWRPG